MTDTLFAAIKSLLEVTAKDVVKFLTNSHVICGTKSCKIEKIKQALAGHDQLRSSLVVNGRDGDHVAEFDLLLQRLSASVDV
jgi:hypothetical protein